MALNPMGGLVVLLGGTAVAVGLTGSQRKVLAALKAARPSVGGNAVVAPDPGLLGLLNPVPPPNSPAAPTPPGSLGFLYPGIPGTGTTTKPPKGATR